MRLLSTTFFNRYVEMEICGRPTLFQRAIAAARGAVTRRHKMPLYDEVAPRLLLGRAPRSACERRALMEARVSAVVCLLDAPPPFRAAHTLHLPTANYFRPTPAQMRRGDHFLSQHRAAGRVVFVYCASGRGRSAKLVARHLATERGVDLADAHQSLRRVRRIAPL